MTQKNYTVEQGLQINSTVGNTTIDNNGITQMPDQDFTILVQDADDDDYALNLDVDDGAGNILARAQLTRGDFAITTDFAGAGHNWTFDNTGRLNLPGNIAFSPTGGNASFYAVDDGSTGSVELKTISYAGDLLGSNIRVTQSNATISTGNAAHTWTFDNTGTLTLPNGDAAIVPDLGGTTAFQGAANTGVVVTSSGSVGSVTTSWVDQTEDMANAKTASMTLNVGGTADVQIQVADLGANSINNWTFDNTGNLTLPGNTFAVNYANGTAVSLGGGGSYGDSNVVSLLAAYGSNTISTTGTITSGNILSNGYARLSGSFDESQASTAGLYLGYAGGTARIMFGTGNTSQTLEIDNDGGTLRFYKPGTTLASLTNTGNFSVTGNITAGNIIAPASTANTQILFNNAGVVGGSAAFTFDRASNTLNLANSNSTLKVADIQTPTAGVSLRLIPASGITYSYGNFLPLFANTYDLGGSGSRWNNVFANVANVVTLNITGNITGTGSNVTLVAGSYSYTFDNTGILTLPTGSSGNEGGEIAFTQAANSTLAGNTVVIDQYVDQIRFFESGGNTRGAYIDLTQAADGVGTLLNNRVSGRVDAGTFVTMDNLKVTVASSGNRGLSVAAVSGSFSADIGGWYGGSGAAGGDSVTNLSVTTTPSVSLFGWNFVAEANTAQYTIFDNTNNRVYRVTMMIGPAYLNNFISIERLL